MNAIEKRIQFIVEADKLKAILRQSTLIYDRNQRENDAEHTWHLTLCALLLAEHVATEGQVDLLRVLKMLIIHDMVEIEAGDTYCYDEAGYLDKVQRERKQLQVYFLHYRENNMMNLWICGKSLRRWQP